jgi:hypothetical protein
LTSVPLGKRPQTEVFGLTFEKVQAISVWLMFATSFFVIIEPAPTDLLFVAALLLHLRSGLTVSAMAIPLFLYLLVYNIGGFLSYLPVMYEPKTTTFVIITAYMSLSGVFVAFLVAKNPVRNMAIIKNGWVIAAFIASVLGLLGISMWRGSASIWRRPGAPRAPSRTRTCCRLSSSCRRC